MKFLQSATQAAIDIARTFDSPHMPQLWVISRTRLMIILTQTFYDKINLLLFSDDYYVPLLKKKNEV